MVFRFDIVVSNYTNIHVFLDSIQKIQNYDLKRDRIVIMDCSPDVHAEIRKLEQSNLAPAYNFYFYHRRNWNMNHGGQLDYIWLVNEKLLPQAKYVFFMQEHYLNTAVLVKSDTIPEGQTIDLDVIESRFELKPKQIIFNSRFGFRVSAMPRNREFDDYKNLDSELISFVVDGANFCVISEYLQDYFADHPDLLIDGNGKYSFCHVWETRFTKIFYDFGFDFHELSRGLSFPTIDQLTKSYPEPCEFWRYAYQNREAWFLYGRKIFPTTIPIREAITVLRKFIFENRRVEPWNPPVRFFFKQ